MIAFVGLACAPEPEAPRDIEPAPVWGGNLLARADGTLVASDPAADVLVFARIVDSALLVDEILPVGRDPWRLAEDGDGAVWVSLRGDGAVARVRGTVETFPVCSDPRGVWADADGVAVACAGGEFVRLDLDGNEVERVFVAPDLRDVIRVGDAWWVSTFRDAAVWVVGGSVLRPPEVADRRPEVAWRLRPDPTSGGAVMSHQRARTDLVQISDLAIPAYGSDACDAAVEPAITRFFPDGAAETTGPMRKSVLPVDIAVDAADQIWLASAGADGLSDVGVGWVDADLLFLPGDTCRTAPGYPWSAITIGPGGGRVTAVEPVGDGLAFAVQSPFGLVYADGTAVRSRWWSEQPVDRGVHLFHAAPVGAVACASCHPEGAEDGHVWRFGVTGGEQVRRTQSLAGGASANTAPLHWDGTLVDLDALLVDTFEVRMGGTLLGPDVDAFTAFLASTPRTTHPAPGPAAGEAVFVAAGCPACHAPPWYTDGLNHDVGTGEAVQTPPLVGLGARGPWMHDGCAEALEDRFDPSCGGDAHGAPIAAEDLPVLVNWLLSL